MLASIAVISVIRYRFNLPAIAETAKRIGVHEDVLIRAMQPSGKTMGDVLGCCCFAAPPGGQ